MARKPKVNKTSRYRRRDDGLWLKSRYLMYRWWFKFLQYAEQDPSRTVDWSKYEGWGDPEAVLGQRFETWWKERWKDLFAVKEENDTARYEITHRKARAGTIRVALLVYEHRHRTDSRAIFDALNKRYKNLSSLDRYETDKDGIVLIDERGKAKERLIETKYLNQHVKRYRQQAEHLLDEVCAGRFG